MTYSNIPELLRKYNHWVCWRYEDHGKPKLDKVPKNPRTGNNAKVNDPATWASFEEAVRAKEEYGFDGIGFVLDYDKVPLVGSDLDECVNGDSIEPWAKEIVDKINSFTQISPSETGLRIFALGDLPDYGRKKGDIEMYISGRFLTVTDNHLPGTPLTVEHRADEILAVHQSVFGKPEPKEPAALPEVKPISLADNELLQVAFNAENGSKIQELWEGHINGYSSQSEADQALANHLAFYCGRDSQRIDQLFRQSGLYRKKWDKKHKADGSTYGQMTIKKAVENTTEIYTPNGTNELDDLDLTGLTEEQAQEEEEFQGSSWADLKEVIGPIQWMWPGWLPLGFQSMAAAYSGIGKSNLLLHIAKVITTGCNWPDGTPYEHEAGKVLWCETENAHALNLDRAITWSIPIEAILSPLEDPLGNVSLDDKQHIEAIFKCAQRDDVKLIIVDSFSGGTQKEAISSSKIGPLCNLLAAIAKRTNKPLLISHHLNKPQRGIAENVVTLPRVRDSSAIVQYSRVVWAIDEPDAEEPERKRLYVIKNNLTKYPIPIGFDVTDDGLIFGDAPNINRASRNKKERAENLLLKLLADGRVATSTIEELSKSHDISMETMRRAKKNLGIISEMDGVWYWRLPHVMEITV